MTRGGLTVVAVTVAVVAALHGLAWSAGCFMLERGLQQAGPALAAQGWRLQSGPSAWTGWPWAAAIHLPNAALAGAATDRPGLVWSVQDVVLRVSPLHPTILDVLPQGTQSLGLGALPPLRFQAAAMRLSFPLGQDGPPELAGAGLTADTPAGPVTVGTLAARGLPGAFTAELRDIALPPPLHRLLDSDVALLSVRASLTRPIPLAATPQASAAAWRNAGGSVEVPDLSLRWGVLDVTGHGAGRLDARLQPELEAALTVGGYTDTLDALVRSGALPARTASAAKAVLGLVAMAARGGPIPLPLTVRDGLLVAARFPLLRLPELDWDALR